MNPIYQEMNQRQDSIAARFNQFRQSFSGDPKQQVQQLLNSGRVSQAQYNQAVEKANQLSRLFGIR